MGEKNRKPEVKVILKGVCTFYAETGTEGGYWAFQDAEYIQKNVGRGYCRKCGKWLREQIGPIKIERVYPITEELLHSEEASPERLDCPDNAHEEEIGDVWDYKGLHILKSGDRLTIYPKDNPEEIVWQGNIKLREYPLFTEDALGLWIHADQEGIDRETWARWFFDEYPAELTTVIKLRPRESS